MIFQWAVRILVDYRCLIHSRGGFDYLTAYHFKTFTVKLDNTRVGSRGETVNLVAKAHRWSESSLSSLTVNLNAGLGELEYPNNSKLFVLVTYRCKSDIQYQYLVPIWDSSDSTKFVISYYTPSVQF